MSSAACCVDYQRELYGTAPETSDRLHAISGDIEALLTRYIARTERIGAAGQHDAMLRHVPRVASPTPADLHQYLLAQDVAHELDQHDVTELWKSAPYLLNFLDGYKLRSRFDAACKAPEQATDLAALLNATKAELLDRAQLRAYDAVDPGGPRMRELAKDVIDSEAWRLLWIPPSMPYHELGGAYARPQLQRLHQAPRFLRLARRPARSRRPAQLPRRAATHARGRPGRAEHARTSLESAQPPRLRDRGERTSHRHAGARIALPVADARRRRRPAQRSPPLIHKARSGICSRGLKSRSPRCWIDFLRVRQKATSTSAGTGPPLSCSTNTPTGGRIPIWLRSGRTGTSELRRRRAAGWSTSNWRAPPRTARSTRCSGRRPEDLPEVLARLAVGGPGTLALRALMRVTSLPADSLDARLPAARIAWALRGLFNAPEATALLRSSRASREDTYWREVLAPLHRRMPSGGAR